MLTTQSAFIHLGDTSMDEFARTVWRKRPVRFPHFIADFPRGYLDIRRMARLLDSSRHVFFRPGNIPKGTPQVKELPRFSVEDTLEKHLASDNIHFSIHKAEKEDPVVADFAQKMEAHLREALQPYEGKLLRSSVILFMASPNAITKYHADPNNSFLFHLWGRKTAHVYPEYDPEVFPKADKERFAMDPANNQPNFYEKCKQVEQRFDLEPGDTLYMPAMWPHWVSNGPEPSLSLSIQFEFESDYKWLQVLKCNGWLRRMGWQPKGYGRSPALDNFKSQLWSSYERALEALPERVRKKLRADQVSY